MNMLLLLVSQVRAEALKIGVEAVTVTAGSESFTMSSGELLRRVEGRLLTGKVAVVHRPPSYFEADTPNSDLRLGMRVDDLDCRPVDEDSIRCKTRVEIDLYHRPSDTVVYRTALDGVGIHAEPDESLARSILSTVDLLVHRPRFVERLDGAFYPAIPAREALRPCAEPSSPVTLSVGNAQVLPLDDDGQVLVVGATPETLDVLLGQGPMLTATRLREGAGLGLYDLPIAGGIGCTAGTTALATVVTTAAGTATTVDEALAALVVARVASPPVPKTFFDNPRVGSGDAAAWEEDDDTSARDESYNSRSEEEDMQQAQWAADEARARRTMGWTLASLGLLLLMLAAI